MSINVKQWKVTTCGGRQGHPDEFYPVKEVLPYVDHLPDDSWRLHCLVGGVHTENSSFCRVEFREKNLDGSNASWSNYGGIHILEGAFTVTKLPPKRKRLTVAQIHDANDDVIEVILHGTTLFVDHNGQNLGTLSTTLREGQKFYVSIVADPASGIRVYYRLSGSSETKKITYRKFGVRWYFKGGCYLQTSTQYDDAKSWGEVIVHDLHARHYS